MCNTFLTVIGATTLCVLAVFTISYTLISIVRVFSRIGGLEYKIQNDVMNVDGSNHKIIKLTLQNLDDRITTLESKRSKYV